ncbi:MAG: DUF1080 domain-containing protein [Verrucomicrobiota bacterium]
MSKTLLSSLITVSLFCLNLSAQTEPAAVPEKPEKNGWVKLFDGKTLSGWTAPDAGEWKMEDGVLKGSGERSHLFSPNVYTNLEFKVEVKLNHSGNSGMYFRAKYGKGWPEGYEAQVENTSPDPQKTGSLYNAAERKFQPLPVAVREQLIQDDTWWTQHIIAIGNRIIIKVNDKIVTDFVDENHTMTSGHLAFQQHNQGSEVQYRNVMVKRLPSDEKAAWKEAKKDVPELKEILMKSK